MVSDSFVSMAFPVSFGCFVLFSTLRCFPGSCPLGHLCQPERLHRRSLAIAIAVASVSYGFISGAFHLQWCSHLTFVLLVRSYVGFLPWFLLSQYGDQLLLQWLLWFFCLMTRLYLRFPFSSWGFLSDVVALWDEPSSFYGRYFDQLFHQLFLVRLDWYLTRSYLWPSLLVLGSP